MTLAKPQRASAKILSLVPTGVEKMVTRQMQTKNPILDYKPELFNSGYPEDSFPFYEKDTLFRNSSTNLTVSGNQL